MSLQGSKTQILSVLPVRLNKLLKGKTSSETANVYNSKSNASHKPLSTIAQQSTIGTNTLT